MRGESLEVKSERLPEGWKCEKIKYIVSLRTSHSLNNKNFIGLENVASWSGELTNHQSDSVPEGETMQVNKRDVLFGKLRPYLAKVYLAENDACCSPEFLVLRANEDKILPHLLKYIFLNHQIIDEINKSTYGTKMPRASWNFIGNLTVSLPSLTSQFSLITFLDRKCAEIDELAALQETMIAELKRYKQSVITEAVTGKVKDESGKMRVERGKMKDSGVEWIGEIPEGWEIGRIKNVASLYGRIGFRGYTSDDLNKDGIGAITLSPSNMLPMSMDYSSVTYLSWKKYEESPEIMIQNGDLLMVKTGSSYGKVSYVSALPREATINPQILRIVPKIHSKYLAFYLQTSFFSFQVEGGVVGGTIPTISQEKINNFRVILPPLAEQRAIADYLDRKCGEIDELIAIKQQKIEQLKEYKKSVIFEYVTGKKEVAK